MHDLKWEMHEVHDAAHAVLGQEAESASKYYNQKVNETSFAVGDKVWLYVKGRKRVCGRVPKFMPAFEGPYVVIHVVDSRVYVIERGRSKRSRKVVHHDDLKLYVEREKVKANAPELLVVPKVVSPPESGDDLDRVSEVDSDVLDGPPDQPMQDAAPSVVPADSGKDLAQNVCETAVVRPRRNANAPKRLGDWVFSVSLENKVDFV